MLALDHAIFGDGFGLRSPYHDNVFLWLVDTDHRKGLSRSDRRGELYTFSAGFGAQLHSKQWTMPKPGEERVLGGYRFRVFNACRRWLRVEVTWGWVDLPRGINEANAALHEMRLKLGNDL